MRVTSFCSALAVAIGLLVPTAVLAQAPNYSQDFSANFPIIDPETNGFVTGRLYLLTSPVFFEVEDEPKKLGTWVTDVAHPSMGQIKSVSPSKDEPDEEARLWATPHTPPAGTQLDQFFEWARERAVASRHLLLQRHPIYESEPPQGRSGHAGPATVGRRVPECMEGPV